MSKKAFITGIAGQDGAYLSKFLLEKGYEVHGGVRPIDGINHEKNFPSATRHQVHLHDFELMDIENIRAVLNKVAPDEVYNLA